MAGEGEEYVVEGGLAELETTEGQRLGVEETDHIGKTFRVGDGNAKAGIIRHPGDSARVDLPEHLHRASALVDIAQGQFDQNAPDLSP